MKCPDCTIAGPCVAEWTGHRPFCGWMRAGGPWRDRVVELSSDPPSIDIGPVADRPIPVDYDLPARPHGRCCG